MVISQRVNILGYPVNNLTMGEAVQKVDEFIISGKPHQITVINANKICLADKYTKLADILQTSDIVIPEQAIIIASKLLKNPLTERVSGIELMERLLTEAPSKGYRIFLLGAKPEVIERLVEVSRERYEGINIVGYSDGYFRNENEIEILEKIRESHPEILFVALGSPKQEFWIRKHLHTLNVPVCLGVGGSFDVLAGYKKQAPQWMRCGLEWLYRLIQDPRLWKRYFTTNSILLWKILKTMVLGK